MKLGYLCIGFLLLSSNLFGVPTRSGCDYIDRAKTLCQDRVTKEVFTLQNTEDPSSPSFQFRGISGIGTSPSPSPPIPGDHPGLFPSSSPSPYAIE